jgi:hypothetical protein
LTVTVGVAERACRAATVRTVRPQVSHLGHYRPVFAYLALAKHRSVPILH